MGKKWIGVDVAYDLVERHEPEALQAMDEVPNEELLSMKQHTFLLFERLTNLPETTQELELIKDMIKSVQGIGVFLEVAIVHKAKMGKV
jgi:hypothetical protein